MHTELVQFTRLFVRGVFFTRFAIFIKRCFFRRINFIPVTDIVLPFTYGTKKGKYDALVFFSHR